MNLGVICINIICTVLHKNTETNISNKKNVFIIDDDKQYLNLMAHMFADKPKFDVHTYHDGFVAMADFFTYKPDVIILDNDMPKITGIEIVKSLGQQILNTHLLVVTSNFKAMDTLKSLGVKDFLPKPFNIQDLFAIIQNYS